MDLNHRRLVFTGAMLVALPFVMGSVVYAATPVNLRHQNVSVLQSLVATPAAAKSAVSIAEISRHVDFKNTLHVRVQETYSGYNVWGADAVVHIPNGAKTPKSFAGVAASANNNSSMNGTIYQDLGADLANAPAAIFTQANAQKALKNAIETFQHTAGGKSDVSQQTTNLMVFVDKTNKAHWAYKISFRAEAIKTNEKPAKPAYIMDATSFQVYATWDDIKTLEAGEVDGGGFGGNIKMGRKTYDGAVKHLAKLNFTRNEATNTCSLTNSDVVVKDYNSKTVVSFLCKKTNPKHNEVYFDGDFDAVNDGFSPANDALFGGQVIKHMYQDWYGVPVLTNPDGSPMVLGMVVHVRNYDNAYWDGKQMTFGDGMTTFYPLTSLGVAAHEISHGFTEQHAGLAYYGMSGGMNEAFSDMAAQAAEVYAYGHKKNSWQIGPEIFKAEDQALRYMDQPSKDCNGKEPGDWCSIDDASQYTEYLDVHFSSGVYNHFFYALGTSGGWDAKKAFDVMVHANSNYWTSNTTFSEGACGVIAATKDLGYGTKSVKAAFDTVKVDYSDC